MSQPFEQKYLADRSLTNNRSGLWFEHDGGQLCFSAGRKQQRPVSVVPRDSTVAGQQRYCLKDNNLHDHAPCRGKLVNAHYDINRELPLSLEKI
jgi:hypothetical protein